MRPKRPSTRTDSSAAVALLWVLALALARHPSWLLVHIGCGIAAIAAGPFQFVASLRASHPAVHRATGYIYLLAVALGGCAGVRLAPDTAQFVADGLNDHGAFASIGIAPGSLGFAPHAAFDPSQFLLVVLGFAALATVWLVASAAALIRARQRRFTDHRAWMIRSYSLTFAAVTVRLVSVPLFVVTQNPVVAITLTFWSWVLNLIVAEWLIRGDGWLRTRDA